MYLTLACSSNARVVPHPPNFFTPSRLPRELRPLVVEPPAAFEAHRFATNVVPAGPGQSDKSEISRATH